MKFLLSLVFLTFSATLLSDGEKKTLRWKFKKDGRLEYSLLVTVMEENGGRRVEKRLKGVVIITGKSEEEAVFLRRYDELRWREGKVSYYTPTAELHQLTVRFRIKNDGRVTTDTTKEALQESLTALFPLPSNAVSKGDIWGVELKTMGVVGSCEFRGYEKKGERNCVVLLLNCSRTAEGSDEPEKILETKAYFDVEEGCFVYVERWLKDHTDGLREELLTLTLESSPARPSKKRLMENLLDELRSRLLLSPSDTALRTRLIRLLIGMGRYQEALKEVEKGINIRETPEFYLLGGKCTLALGDGLRALAFFKKALEMEKDSKKALLGASEACFVLKRYKESLAYARRSFSSGKGPYEALYYIGASLAKLGRRVEAEEMLRAYIKANPDFDKNKKWLITFTKNGDVQILAERRFKGDIATRSQYTEDELELARQLLSVVVKEEAVRMRLSPEELEKMLRYIAKVYGKKAEEMLSDFLADRVQTSELIRKKLDAKMRAYEKQIADLDFKSHSGEFSAAALSMLSEPDILARYNNLNREKPGVVAIYLELTRLYLTNPARFEKETISMLQFLKNMEPDNAAYALLEAWLHYSLKNQKRALDCIAKSALCRDFSMHILEAARQRRKVLRFLDYPNELVDVTAWTTGRSWMVRPIKEALDATLLMAKKAFENGRYEQANKLALLVHRISVLIGSRTTSALLFCASVGLQEVSISLMLSIAERRKEEERRKRLAQLLDAARRRSEELLNRYQSFIVECEKAFTVWWITEPKKCSTFLEQLFNIGEKKSLLRGEIGGK